MRKIVVDIYGADAGPQVILEGVQAYMSREEDFQAVLVGDEELIRSCMAPELLPRITVLHAPDFITNHDSPASILTTDCRASMRLALEHLRRNEDCVGLVSAGNTGALLVGSIFKLGMVRGMKQPALATALPLWDGKMVCLVDCGAAIECKARSLAMFALLGELYMRSVYGLPSPRVGLMSVGREPSKGSPLTLETYSVLEKLPIHFVGNLEGNDLCQDGADVVVCDGFSGNILLKNTEATGKLAARRLRQLARTAEPEAAAALQKAADTLHYEFDFNSRGGAAFLGTKKPVVKMHGCANAQTVCACMDLVLRLDAGGFTAHVTQLGANLPQGI